MAWAFRKMQIKATVGYWPTPSGNVKVKSDNNAKCRHGWRTTEALTHRWWECKMHNRFGNSLIGLSTHLYDTEIPLLKFNQQKSNVFPQKDLEINDHCSLFVFFTKVWNWKEPKCQSTGEWINKEILLSDEKEQTTDSRNKTNKCQYRAEKRSWDKSHS